MQKTPEYIEVKIDDRSQIFNLEGLRNLDRAIVLQAFRDIKKNSDPQVWTNAVLFIFLRGTPEDLNDPGTFLSLCARNGSNPDFLAKAIWEKLSPKTQERIILFFKQRGLIREKYKLNQ